MSFHIGRYSYKLVKKAEVRNPNQINRIRSSLYGEWKWRVISEEAILVVVDWMQNWMRSHCFYCMDLGDCYVPTSPHFILSRAHIVWMVWLNVTIVIVTDAFTAFGFLIQPFSQEINLFSSYWMFDRFLGFVVKDCKGESISLLHYWVGI